MSFLFLATMLGLSIWVIILFLPFQSYRVNESLETEITKENLDDVTVLIPARNEAQTIKKTLASLKMQHNDLKVILVDDQSTDSTVKEAKSIKLHNLSIITGTKLPSGWSGKLWALEQGRKYIKTKFLLLLDADIILEPGLIGKILFKAKQADIKLLSLMAHYRMISLWEKLLMPAYVFFFKLLYPFSLSNLPNSRIAAAAGGCILLETEVLRKLGGFEPIKNALIDDCMLARKFKKNGHKTWIGLTHSAISIRQYEKFSEISQLVTRTAYTQLRYSPILLLICMLIMSIAFIIPLIAILQDGSMMLMGLATFFIQIICYFPILKYYSMNPLYALSLSFIGILYMLFTLNSSYHYYFNKGALWKKRYYKN